MTASRSSVLNASAYLNSSPIGLVLGECRCRIDRFSWSGHHAWLPPWPAAVCRRLAPWAPVTGQPDAASDFRSVFVSSGFSSVDMLVSLQRWGRLHSTKPAGTRQRNGVYAVDRKDAVT